MRIFNKLRKFGKRKQQRSLRSKSSLRGGLQFESMEGRVLMAGSVLDDMVTDIGTAAATQTVKSTTEAQVGTIQSGPDFLQPENVADVVQDKVVATAKQWFQDGTYFKKLAEGKTPQQITGDFVKEVAKGTVKELGRQGATELTSLDLEQVDAIIEAGETAIGVLTGDPVAYYNAAKLGYKVGQETGNAVVWLNDMAKNDPGQPWRDPLKSFETNVEEALNDNKTKQDIVDELSLDGMGGYPDPFKMETTGAGTGGQFENTTPGGGGADVGGAAAGGQAEQRPGVAETATDHVEQSLDPSAQEGGGADGIGGGGEPQDSGADPEDGGGVDPGEDPSGAEPGGDDGGGNEPNPFKWHRRNEDGSWTPLPDDDDDDGDDEGDDIDLLQEYDEDEILDDDEDDDGGDDGDDEEEDDGGDGEEGDEEDDGAGDGGEDDGGDDDGAGDDEGAGGDEDADGEDDSGQDGGGQDDVDDEDGGYEDPDGITGFRPPPISDAEFMDMMEKQAESLTNPSDPYDTGEVRKDLPMEVGKLGHDPRLVNPVPDGEDQGQDEDIDFSRPNVGPGPDPGPILHRTAGTSGSGGMFSNRNLLNGGSEIPTP